jgi:hypothetical protein
VTESSPGDMLWREATARRVLCGITDAPMDDLIKRPWPHTSAEFWTGDPEAAGAISLGWLYWNDDALLYIADEPVWPPKDRDATEDDRLLHRPFTQLGELTDMLDKKDGEYVLKFSDGSVFALPAEFAATIAQMRGKKLPRPERASERGPCGLQRGMFGRLKRR